MQLIDEGKRHFPGALVFFRQDIMREPKSKDYVCVYMDKKSGIKLYFREDELR